MCNASIRIICISRDDAYEIICISQHWRKDLSATWDYIHSTVLFAIIYRLACLGTTSSQTKLSKLPAVSRYSVYSLSEGRLVRSKNRSVTQMTKTSKLFFGTGNM